MRRFEKEDELRKCNRCQSAGSRQKFKLAPRFLSCQMSTFARRITCFSLEGRLKKPTGMFDCRVCVIQFEGPIGSPIGLPANEILEQHNRTSTSPSIPHTVIISALSHLTDGLHLAAFNNSFSSLRKQDTLLEVPQNRSPPTSASIEFGSSACLRPHT